MIGALLLTSGYHSGISRELANKIRTEGFLNPENKVVMLGIADWYTIAKRSRLINKFQNEDDLDKVKKSFFMKFHEFMNFSEFEIT